MTAIAIERAGPLCTVQDSGRPGALRYGISASGPMDRAAFERGGAMLREAGRAALEFTRAGLAFTVEGAAIDAAFTGGAFSLSVNGRPCGWRQRHTLAANDRIEITPGAAGNYGYVRFAAEIDVPVVLGSRATNIVAGLGGFAGRPLKAGDWLPLDAAGPTPPTISAREEGVARPIRIIWGLHADLFDAETRLAIAGAGFEISPRLDRMGVQLVPPTGAFATAHGLALVSDAIVPGDIQILGNGTPIVLMRDHQPTGGYPRIATVVSADFDRFAQLRPGTVVRFDPVTPKRARALLMEA